MFEARENALAVVGRGFDIGLGLHRLEGSALVGGKVLGNEYHDVYKFVAGSAILIVGQTFAAETEHFAGLSSGGYIDACATGNSGYLDCTAECCGGYVEHEVVYHVGTVADKFGMLYFLDYNKKVAWNASALGIVAFAAECECLAFGSARRD